jgi:hypothetical protein
MIHKTIYASTEEWLPVPDLEGYEVSNYGNVRHTTITVCQLKQQTNPRGRKTVSISTLRGSRNKPIHVLIALAFLGNRPAGLVINHKDGDKTNNAASNLEYITPRENHEHALKMGLYKGPNTPARVLSEQSVILIKQLLSSGISAKLLAKQFKVSHGAIMAIKHKRTWKFVA